MPEPELAPVWDSVELPAFPPIERDITVDVAIIGAGLTGITAACLLAEGGVRVALLDRRGVGGVDTGCTTAHLTPVVDRDLPSLVQTLGRDHAQAVWDAGWAAIEQIDRLTAEHGIACDFSWVPGFRHAPFESDGDELGRITEALRDEAELARELGFDLDVVASTPLVDRPGWRIENQALFHPRKYLAGLLGAVLKHGGRVFADSPVAFTDEPGVLRSGAHTIRAREVIVATHNPLQGQQGTAAAAFLQTKLALYTTYAMSAHVPPPFDTALAAYWDTSEPYRYVRVDRDGDGIRIIAGGEDHKTGQEPDTRTRFDALASWLVRLVPAARITHRWSGQVIESSDGLPLIGEVARGQHIATGYAGNGMTFGTVAALMLRDAVLGRTDNPWRDLFDVHRSAVSRGPLDYLRENADYPYYLVRDRFAGVPTRHLRSVAPGEGLVTEVEGEYVAACRDEKGRLTLLSPVCTHLGCRVAWNQAERTWDCPCHGSRFAATGAVLSGPAEAPLEPMRGLRERRTPPVPPARARAKGGTG